MIFKKDSEVDVFVYVCEIVEEFRMVGIRVYVDECDIRFGRKYYDWEFKGVLFRIEVGLRDVEGKKVVLVRRDIFEKIIVERDNIVEEVRKIFDVIYENFY